MLRPGIRGRGRTSATTEARSRTRITASVSVPALQTPASAEASPAPAICSRAAPPFVEKQHSRPALLPFVQLASDGRHGPGLAIIGKAVAGYARGHVGSARRPAEPQDFACRA
jgi:hypothetical protein